MSREWGCVTAHDDQCTRQQLLLFFWFTLNFLLWPNRLKNDQKSCVHKLASRILCFLSSPLAVSCVLCPVSCSTLLGGERSVMWFSYQEKNLLLMVALLYTTTRWSCSLMHQQFHMSKSFTFELFLTFSSHCRHQLLLLCLCMFVCVKAALLLYQTHFK